jgi:DNA repair exonuclease SbcCD ATPase subunit/DNA repair exonuclease SbcCD nuclease subunit
MSILFTADWQCEWQNIDTCNKAWNEVLSISRENKVDLICILGDLKQAMNPVDVRVIKWWKSAFSKALKVGLEIVVLLGNHDRVGQYSSAENWLSIFKHKGIHLFDKPDVFKWHDYTLSILPYQDVTRTRLGATSCKEALYAEPNKHNKINILLFHCDLTGVRYNQQGSKSDAKLKPVDLFVSSYRYCIGGHVHLPQLVASTNNTYYVGSPFCHDWGECNQIKRYLVVRSDGNLESIPGKLPRWYDKDVSGFKQSIPKVWAGAKIRVAVQCDASEDYGRRLEKAKRRAEKKYRGAQIYVVPKFNDASESRDATKISTTDSDKHKITQYVLEMASRGRIKRSDRLINYMLEKLSHFAGGLRPSSQIKFISASGDNFLSFKKLELDFTKKGITLIQGINQDRNNKSNGAGKTSITQLLPVSWFGTTFKGQKHDSWANRWIEKEPAFAKTVILNSDGKKIKIVRGRRPPILRMYVDGKDKSSGMRTTDREGTQQQIEKTTGFTWQTLANAIYIDRTVADAFLAGTKKQRTDVLSRFQNLERFAKALDLVKKDTNTNRVFIHRSLERLSKIRGAIKAVRESIKDLKTVAKSHIQSAYKAWKQAEKDRELFLKKYSKRTISIGTKAGKIKRECEHIEKKLRKAEKEYAITESKYSLINRKMLNAKKLKDKKECPTCMQKVSSEWVKTYQTGVKIVMEELNRRLAKQNKIYRHYSKKVQVLDNKYTLYQLKLQKFDDKNRDMVVKIANYRDQYDRLNRKNSSDKVINKSRYTLKKLVAKKKKLKHKLRKYKKLRKMYGYCADAFSRDGIPAFLNKLLCPVLNKASNYYAELFSDSELQVQFAVEEGEFVPKIINTRGGAEIDDQSEGERALAGLIASFALREVAPQTNLLILDEPGSGLDEGTARQFAESLHKLKKRFGSIFVATHNPTILGALSGERVITVVKHNRISRIQ